MSQQHQRPFHHQMVGGNNNNSNSNNNPGGDFNDTTFTKIFVGGLAWETQRDTMRRYFEQFGNILEAVVITDKNTGRSKGYGFVTFEDPDAAMRACQNPSPVIDGRRANCNLASLGAQNKTRPPTPHRQGAGGGRFRAAPGLVAPPAYHGGFSSTYAHQPTGGHAFPYSAAYAYSGYSQDTVHPSNYYSVYGGQQFSPYYGSGASGSAGMFQNFYPIYAQYPQGSGTQGQGFGVHYHPQMPQYGPYLPTQQHASTAGVLSIPATSSATGVTTGTEEVIGIGASQASATTASEQNSSP